MPHIIIEHSNQALLAETQDLLHSVKGSLINSGLFTTANIKLRLHPVTDFLLDDNLDEFIHIQCRTHQGKTYAQKNQLSEALVNAIAGFCVKKCVITCEVMEMDRASYTKRLT